MDRSGRPGLCMAFSMHYPKPAFSCHMAVCGTETPPLLHVEIVAESPFSLSLFFTHAHTCTYTGAHTHEHTHEHTRTHAHTLTNTHLFIYLLLNHEVCIGNFAILTESCLLHSGISYRSTAISVLDFLGKKNIFLKENYFF